MPEIKNTFLSGKMNKDLDERLVPNNQYIDAFNVVGSTPAGDNTGTLQNSLGNLNKSSLSTYITGGKVIGSCVDRVNDKIYWFITGTHVDAIAEYDSKTEKVVPVLVDYVNSDLIINEEPTAGNWTISSSAWTLTPGSPNYATAVDSLSGNLTFDNGSTLFREGLKYKLTYKIKSGSTTTNDFKLKQHGYGGTDIPLETGTSTFEMIWLQGSTNLDKLVFTHNGANLELEDVTVQQVEESFLNFDPSKLITGVNLLDGMLFWTDNNSEPKKINIEKCKAGAYNILNSPNDTKNWTYTTKNIDPNGNVRGNITESDITVIKEYPLHAPKMSLFNTTKEPDLVLESTCTTPLNTTYDYNKPYWLGTSEGGGSSDIIEYKGYIFGYLSEDIVFHTGADRHYRKPQMLFDGLYFKDDADNTLIDYNSGDTGSDLIYPWHRRSPDAVYKDGKGLKYWEYKDNPQNPFTSLSSSEYEKRAWNLWASLETTNHILIVKPDGTKMQISNGTRGKDLYGDRFYLQPKANDKFEEHDNNGVRFGEKGDQIVFFDWFYNNNHSFWTYIDGDGTEFVKPPGTSKLAAKDSDGISLKDNAPHSLDPIILDNDEHFLSTPSDFHTSWTVGPGPDLSAQAEGIDYSQRTIILGAAADTTSAIPSPSGLNIQANGWQTAQRLVTGLKSRRVYLVRIKVRLTNKGIATTQTVNGTFTNVADIVLDSVSGLSVGMYVVGVSSGSLAGAPEITAINSNTITLSIPQTFADGITLSFADYYSICGVTTSDHTGTLTWAPTTSTDDVNDTIHEAGSDAYSGAIYNFGWRLGNSAEADGGPNSDGIYILGGLVTVQNRSTTNSDVWDTDEYEASLNFFKRNNAAVEILSIESNVYASNTIKIQELVFEPKPDYEVGDVIKMTNTTKANNGDDINVTVKLLEENTKEYGQDDYPHDTWPASANTRSLTWADGHQRGVAIFDTTVDSAISNPNDSTYWVAEGSLTLGKNEITCSGLAIGNSRKIRFKNTQGSPTNFLTAGTCYQLEYKVSGHADANNPEDAGYLVLNTANKFNTHLPYDPSNPNNTPSALYSIVIPYHQKHTAVSGNKTLHYATFTPSADTYLDQIELGFAGWNGTLTDLKLYPLTKTEVDIGSQGSNENRKIFNAEIVSIDNKLLQLTREERRYWDCELIEQDPIYENIFPRFAYRWKYRDGEYSAISAFTEVAFLPNEEYVYDAKNGYNLAMTNNVRKIVLKDFQTTPKNVIEVDILYKESDSNSIYTITTITQNELDTFTKYEITKEQLHALVESNQMLRPYDNVPRKAKAQEITANRLLYGNYTQQYNLPSSQLPQITANIATSILDISGNSFPSFGKSIKSIRNYQVGLSFLDKFGRQSPVFSNTNLNENSLINLPQVYSKTANSIRAKLTNNPPDWVTHYKFFVKDSANEYHNISLDRFYQGENESHFWLSFSSADFNKVQEDDYLIIKKQHDSDIAIEPAKTLKYKVLAKQGSPPDFLRIARVLVGGRIDSSGTNAAGTKFSNLNTHAIVGDGLEFASQSSYGGSTAGYPLVNKTTFRLRGDIVDANSALKEALLQSQADRYIRIGKNNSSKVNDISNYYEILSVTRVDGDNTLGYGESGDYYEFTLLKPLDIDASFVGESYSDSRNLFLEYYAQDFLAYDSSFEGKFFVKLLKDADLDFHIARKQRLTDAALNIVNTQETNWAFCWENNSTINTNADIGQDTDNWLTQTSNFKWIAGYPGGVNDPYNAINSIYNGSTVTDYHGETIDYQFDSDTPGSNLNIVVFDNVNMGSGLVNSTALTVDDDGGLAVGHYLVWSDAHGADYDPARILGLPGSNVVTLDKPKSFPDDALLKFSKGISTSQTGTNVTRNPFTTTWKGTIGKSDWSADLSVGVTNADNVTQKFMIDQSWAWNWNHLSGPDWLHYSSQDPEIENARLGPGFVVGNSYCGFRFVGIGNVEAGTDGIIGTSDDTNSWYDNGQPLSVEMFDNYNLLKQLRTEGTKFRWSNDPTQTIYTIKSFFGAPVKNYKRGDIINAHNDDPVKSNQGYRIYLQLDKPIVWSPTSTIASGFANNEGGTHTPLTPYGDGAHGTSTSSTSRLEILEYKPSETTYTSDNPAVFEVEPKKRADLNLYYETSEMQMVLKNGMFIEALNNTDVNDGNTVGGNYSGVQDVGTIYAPSGNAKLGYIGGPNGINGFPNKNDIPKSRIIVNPDQPNKFRISPDNTQINSGLPAGITIRISERDDDNFVKYFKDYILPVAVNLGDGLAAFANWITLDLEKLNWHNCFAFGNGVESNRIRDDFNAITIDKGPRVSTTLETDYSEEIKRSSLIYSGMYNSLSGVNKLNEFIQAEKITKDLNPEYGSIQKLFTRNTNVVAFCEDKILKVLANKDALFNADGNSQLLSTNRVLGGVVPFVGEYGISTNPESFANFGYRVYFSDQARGAVLRLSADGLTPISDKGMVNYFKENLSASNNIIGSYDEHSHSYNLTLATTTIGFVEKSDGWTSFKSFLPESGVSLNGVYYTFKNGDMWKHHANTIRNNFYGIQYQSSIKFLMNNNPGVIKSFNTLNYEGTQSREYDETGQNTLNKKGWYVNSIETDLQSGKIEYFKNKEGKWFNNIVGIAATESNIDPKEFTSQGLGLLSSINTGGHPNYKTLSIRGVYGTSLGNTSFGLTGVVSGAYQNANFNYNSPSGTYAFGNQNASPAVTTGWTTRNNSSFEIGASTQNWLEADYHIGDVEYYVMDIFTGLVEGHTYDISAKVIEANLNVTQGNVTLTQLLYPQSIENINVDIMPFSSGVVSNYYLQLVENPDFESVNFVPGNIPGTNLIGNHDFKQIAYHYHKGANSKKGFDVANSGYSFSELGGYIGDTGDNGSGVGWSFLTNSSGTVNNWVNELRIDGYATPFLGHNASNTNGFYSAKSIDYLQLSAGGARPHFGGTNFLNDATYPSDFGTTYPSANHTDETGFNFFIAGRGANALPIVYPSQLNSHTLRQYKSYYVESKVMLGKNANTNEGFNGIMFGLGGFQGVAGQSHPDGQNGGVFYNADGSTSHSGTQKQHGGGYFPANVSMLTPQSYMSIIPSTNDAESGRYGQLRDGFDGNSTAQTCVKYLATGDNGSGYGPLNSIWFVARDYDADAGSLTQSSGVTGYWQFFGFTLYELDPNDHWDMSSGDWKIEYENDGGEQNVGGTINAHAKIHNMGVSPQSGSRPFAAANPSGTHILKSDITLVQGDTYNCTLHISGWTDNWSSGSTTLKLYAGGTEQSIPHQNGSFTMTITCGTTDTDFKIIAPTSEITVSDSTIFNQAFDGSIHSVELTSTTPQTADTSISTSWNFGTNWETGYSGTASSPTASWAQNVGGSGGTATSGKLEASLILDMVTGYDYDVEFDLTLTSGSIVLKTETAGGSPTTIATYNTVGTTLETITISPSAPQTKIYLEGSSFIGEVDNFTVTKFGSQWTVNGNWSLPVGNFLQRSSGGSTDFAIMDSDFDVSSAIDSLSNDISGDWDKKCYELKFEIYDKTAGNVVAYLDTDPIDAGGTGNGHKIINFTPTQGGQIGYGTWTNKRIKFESDDFAGKIDNISLNLLGADWEVNRQSQVFNPSTMPDTWIFKQEVGTTEYAPSFSSWTAVVQGAPNTQWSESSGTLTAVAKSSTTPQYFYFEHTPTAGDRYRIQLTSVSVSAGSFQVMTASHPYVNWTARSKGEIISSGDGTYYYDWNPISSSTHRIAIVDVNSFSNGAAATGAGTFGGFSLKKYDDVALHAQTPSFTHSGNTGYWMNDSLTVLSSYTLVDGQTYRFSLDYTKSQGSFKVTNSDGSVVYATVNAGDPDNSSLTDVDFVANNGFAFLIDGSANVGFIGKITNFELHETVITQGNSPTSPIVGFSTINMGNISNIGDLTRSDNGVISANFVYTRDADNYPDSSGISVFKGDGIGCKVGEFEIIDVTGTEFSSSEANIGFSEKWVVNISNSDSTIESAIINNNYVVNSNNTNINENLYIHSNTVAGIRYAVKASNFTVTSNDPLITITKTNLGVAGTYDNVVKINITRTYNSNDRFPDINTITYIQFVESGDGIILATDQ